MNLSKPVLYISIGIVTVIILCMLMCGRGGARPEKAVPDQVAMVADIEGWVRLRQRLDNGDMANGEIWWNAPLYDVFWSDLDLLSRYFKDQPRVLRPLAGDRIMAGFSLLRSDSLHPLIILRMKDKIKLKKILDETAKISIFRDHRIFTIRMEDNSPMSLATHKGLLICSRFTYLVEDGLNQLDAGGAWWNKRKFRKLYAPDSKAQVHIRTERLIQRISNEVSKPIRRILKYGDEVPFDWAGMQWIDSSLYVRAHASGFSPGWKGKAPSMDILAATPDHFSAVAWLSLADKTALNLENLFQKNTPYSELLLPALQKDMLICMEPPKDGDLSSAIHYVFACQNGEELEQQIEQYSQETEGVYRSEYQAFGLYQFNGTQLLGPFAASESGNLHCVVLGNNLVVSPSRSVVETWIDKYTVNQTLANDTEVLLGLSKTKPNPRAMVFLRTRQLKNWVRSFTGKEPGMLMQNWAAPGLVNIAWEGDSEKGESFHVFRTRENRPGLKAPEILWKANLDNSIQSKPYLFSSSEGEVYILTQDKKGSLYCFDQAGEIRWRREFGMPILSEIHGIDHVRNGTPYFLFNTRNQIFLLNPDGLDVVGFPLGLATPASNGISVYDFDRNRNYNYFIACENGNVYGFDQFGRPLTGWNPMRSMARVTQPILHKQSADRDFLLLLDNEKTIAAFARNGDERFRDTFPDAIGTMQLDRRKKTLRLTLPAADGKLIALNGEGNSFKMSSPLGPSKFLLYPLSPSSQSDYLWLKGKKLIAMGYQGNKFKKRFSTTLGRSYTQLFGLPDNAVGLTDSKNGWISVVNEKGQEMNGFPLAGATPFSWFEAPAAPDQRILIVGKGRVLYAYTIEL